MTILAYPQKWSRDILFVLGLFYMAENKLKANPMISAYRSLWYD